MTGSSSIRRLLLAAWLAILPVLAAAAAPPHLRWSADTAQLLAAGEEELISGGLCVDGSRILLHSSVRQPCRGEATVVFAYSLDGHLLWQTRLASPSDCRSEFATNGQGMAGLVLRHGIAILDSAGRPCVTSDIPALINGRLLQLGADRFYVIDNAARLQCYSFSGLRLWSAETGATEWERPATLLLHDDLLYVGGGDGTVRGYDLHGQLVRQFAIDPGSYAVHQAHQVLGGMSGRPEASISQLYATGEWLCVLNDYGDCWLYRDWRDPVLLCGGGDRSSGDDTDGIVASGDRLLLSYFNEHKSNWPPAYGCCFVQLGAPPVKRRLLVNNGLVYDLDAQGKRYAFYEQRYPQQAGYLYEYGTDGRFHWRIACPDRLTAMPTPVRPLRYTGAGGIVTLSISGLLRMYAPAAPRPDDAL